MAPSTTAAGPVSLPVSLPVSPLVRLISAMGRATGSVGIAGRDASAVRAAREAGPSRLVSIVSARVLGTPSASVREHRRMTETGVAVVVLTPRVPPGAVLPVVVHVHGGGWVMGGIEETPWWVAALAEGLPAVVVSVGYRLAPEHPFPAALEDCLEAVRWVAAHPEHVGAAARVRTDRLALVGDSAGANMCAVTSMRLRDEPRPGDPHVVHQGLVYPSTDARLTSVSMARHRYAPILGRADVDRFLELYTAGTGVDVDDPWLSPLRAASFVGLPPTTVLTAEHDPLRDDGCRYAQALRSAGVRVRHTDYPGAVHGFLSLAGVDRVRTRHAVAELVAAIGADLPPGDPSPGRRDGTDSRAVG